MVAVDAISYLQKLVSLNVELQHYQRRIDLAKEYYDYYTGELNDRLKQIVKRESKEEFDQRVSLTNHITKAILNSTKLPFQKASRKQPIVRKIEFSNNTDTKKKEIEDFLNIYNGDKSLDQYMELMMVEWNMIDPNAFLIVEFKPNTETEKVKPYPFIAPSASVIDYNYINGVINYVIVRASIKFKQGNTEQDGKKYTMYNGNETIVMEQVGIDEPISLSINQVSILINDKDRYIQTIYQVKAKEDPEILTPAAIQFGYILDPETNYETYLSIFDCALPYLRKTLKVNSELDQSMSMMAFPQRFSYAPKCQEPDCNKGMRLDGTTCPACRGTGRAQIHKGAQDVMELDLPDDKDGMLDLNNLLVYKTPPIELLQFDSDFLKDLKVSIHTTIFNADIFSKPEVTATATEKNIDVDNMNDTLYAFCRRYSQIWQFNVYFIAVFTDNVKKDEITIQHKFPSDLKLKTLTDLMGDLKSAYDSNASTATIAAIEDDINEILYSDRPSELKKIKIQQQFHPFRGYSPTDIQIVINSNMTGKFNKTLYANYSNIWMELELENKDLYGMEEVKIWGLIQAKVQSIQDILTAEAPKQVSRLDLTQPQTNSKLKYNQIQVNFKNDDYKISKNEDFIIVPVTLMAEGVHNGSHGPLLHTIANLRKCADLWNGVPITLNHPKKNSVFVSANTSDIKSIGRIYNAKINANKLVAEAWIEKNERSVKIIDDINNNKEIEISIGAYTEDDFINGEWIDEPYIGVVNNYKPDHVAILTNQKGSCSCNDGCGINVNGGEGSGNFDHEGRPGEVGGSGDGGSDGVLELKLSNYDVMYRKNIPEGMTSKNLDDEGFKNMSEVFPTVDANNFWMATNASFTYSSANEFDKVPSEIIHSPGTSSIYKVYEGVLYRGADHWGNVSSCNWYSPVKKPGFIFLKVPLSEMTRNKGILVSPKAQTA